MQQMMRTISPLVLFLVASRAPAAGPVVDHVSPPSWWSAASDQSVTLLIEGSGLKGATVSSSRRGMTFGKVDCPGDGSALFVDVTISADARPGPISLTIHADGGRIDRSWTILPRPEHRPSPVGPDDVIYLIMPDRFANGDPRNDSAENVEDMLDRRNPHAYHGGDFAGLKAKLPYLADLGVTTLWLTPVYKPAPRWFHTRVNGEPRKFADFHGYSPIEFYDTNPRFGSPAEYRDLVDEAHKLGLKVIQDQVIGYLGPLHRWVKNPPAPDWLHGPVDRPPLCNFRFDAQANPYALESERRGLTDGWFFGILPDLDTRNDRVKRQAIQQSLWWATVYSADAIRLDTFPMVDRAFWQDWSKARKALSPDLRAIGEAWVNDAADLSFFQGGRTGWDGIDSGVEGLFDFPLNLAIVDVIANGASAAKLGKALSRDFLFMRPELLVTFLDNHDTPRLAASPKLTPRRLRLAIAFQLTTRGIPQLTWGDEIGMRGHSDDRHDMPGGWPGDARDAFTAAGRTPDEETTFVTYRDLLKLRKSSAALRRGKTVILSSTVHGLAYIRRADGETLLIALNFDGNASRMVLPAEPFADATSFESVYGEGATKRVGDGLVVEIGGEQVAIFRVK